MVVIEAVGIEGVAEYFQKVPAIATESMRLAINTVADRDALKLLRASIEEEVNFPRGYLNRSRLELRKRARNADLEAVIAARDRPTSLSRFVQGAASPVGNRRGGVTVRVKPGSTRRMPRAFLMRLKRGASLTEDNFNVGLAIRLKPGERLFGKRKNVQLGHTLQMLYGPSVAQVFRTVAGDEGPAIAEKVQTEFFRQFARLSGEA